MKLAQIMQQTIAYNAQLKAAFHREARKALKALATALQLAQGTFEIRSNQGGIAVSGEVTLHAEWFYVQVSQSCVNLPGIMFRTVSGRKDYTGGRNHYAAVTALENPSEFAQVICNLGPHVRWP